MSTGSLIFPIGYVPLDDNGAPVPSGKLYFERTGTSTDQDTYSDSTLSTPNANPVVLNSAGRLTTHVYGDPSSGFDYRVRLTTSADVEVWSFDDVVVDGADTATIIEGSFTGTLTGYASNPTGTVYYRIAANSAGTGKVCQLYLPSAISGTSNANTMTLTGLPAACQPSISVWVSTAIRDDGNYNHAAAFIDVSSPSVIAFWTDANLSPTGFTTSGTKALPSGWNITYAL